MVDDQEISVRVVSGAAYKKNHAGSWAKKRDPEPYRIQMSHAWNVWEQNTKPFQEAMIKRQAEREAIESRDAQIYLLELRPNLDPNGAKYKPLSLQGKIWVDKKTAVRLKANIDGVLSTPDGKKTVSLSIERSKIGHSLSLKEPITLPKEKE